MIRQGNSFLTTDWLCNLVLNGGAVCLHVCVYMDEQVHPCGLCVCVCPLPCTCANSVHQEPRYTVNQEPWYNAQSVLIIWRYIQFCLSEHIGSVLRANQKTVQICELFNYHFSAL